MAAEGQNEEKPHKKEYRYLDPSMGGGPKGLGDPDSRLLRTVEKDICIPAKMKVKAKVLCRPVMEAFAECAKETGILLPFKCRGVGNEMRVCLEGWYTNEEFVKECTEEYLKERSEYRRTGIKTKMRRKESDMA